MNSLIVYFSKFGNTKMVAERIASTMELYGSSRAVSLEQLLIADLCELDLFIIGCPTHVMNIPKAVKPLLKALPKRSLQGVHAAAFDTSYKMSRWLEPFTAARRLQRSLRSLGGKMAAKPETFHVMESEGPLYEGEIERAQAWAAELGQVVNKKFD